MEKNKEFEPIWRSDALRKVLKEVHLLFVMFHGSIRALLDKDPGGGLTRSHLYHFVMDYLGGKLSYSCVPTTCTKVQFYFVFGVRISL